MEKNKGHDLSGDVLNGIAALRSPHSSSSLGIDSGGGEKRFLPECQAGQRILDLASGTGDVALEIARPYPQAD